MTGCDASRHVTPVYKGVTGVTHRRENIETESAAMVVPARDIVGKCRSIPYDGGCSRSVTRLICLRYSDNRAIVARSWGNTGEADVSISTDDKARGIGPYSRPHRLWNTDGRTRIGRLIRDFERGLIDHVGGSPTATQRNTIDIAVGLKRQIVLLELRGITTDHDRKAFASWNNGLRLAIRDLGHKPAAPAKPPSLAEYAASRKVAAV